jgi:hypothetical protein
MARKLRGECQDRRPSLPGDRGSFLSGASDQQLPSTLEAEIVLTQIVLTQIVLTQIVLTR